MTSSVHPYLNDYKAVQSNQSGQVLHGENYHAQQEREQQEARDEQARLDNNQARLSEILEHARDVVKGRDCTDLFMAADERQDGHCSYDNFAQLLNQMGLGLSDHDGVFL